MNEIKTPLLIYDSECNLCDKSVRFILDHEIKEDIYFTHMNSALGKEIKNFYKLDEDYDSVLFYENDRLYAKSDAVLRISLHLKAPYSLLPFFFWVPLFIRDGLYDLIAGKRYKWYGKSDCIIADERLKKRFID